MNEILILACTIYGEARGESYAGMVAVGWVIKNRAANPSWWGSTISTVCLQPKQFSCWDDSNRIKMLTSELNNPTMLSCLRAAIEAMQGATDPTMGADHYHTNAVNPSWRDDSKFTVQIGNHRFYRLRAGLRDGQV